MIAIFIKFLIFLPITPLAALATRFKLTSLDSLVAETLVYVVGNIGYEPAYAFHIIYSSTNPESSYRQNYIINNFLLRTTQTVLVTINDVRHLSKQPNRPKRFTLLLIDSEEAFECMDRILKSRQYNTKGKHLVLVSHEIDKPQQLIQKIFDIFFENYIVNVELIIKNHTTGFIDIYTYFPVGSSYCFRVIPVLHVTFGGSIQSVGSFRLFPPKFNNFFGCQLKVVTFPFPPHVSLENDRDRVKATGIDIKVLNGIAEKLNFSIGIVDSSQRGVQYKNGTLTGALKILYESGANITLGGYGSAAKAMLLFSPSVAYLHTAMVFALPAMHTYSPLERLLLPFEFNVWLAIGLIFVLTFISSIVLNEWKKSYRDLLFGNTVRHPAFEMIVVYFGGQVARFPKGAFARHHILQWLLVSLILSSYYKAILFGMLKSGFTKNFPSTLEGMLDQGFVIDVPLALMQNLKDGPLGNRDSFHLLKFNICTHYAYLQSENVKRMVVDTDIQLQYFNSIYYEAGILDSLPQRLFIFPIYFYFRKDSFLIEPFDAVLNQFIQNGLIMYWKDTVLNISRLEKIQPTNTMKQFKVKHLQGCFSVCGVLVASSVVVFILEIISLRLRWVEKLITFLNK